MRIFVIILLAVVLVGCAHTQTACTCAPLPTRSLALFGSFDSSTTLEDITARVGEADLYISISGLESRLYRLTEGGYLDIQTYASSSRIKGVKLGEVFLYDGYSNH